MKKLIGIMCACGLAAAFVFAGNSGVSDASNSISDRTATGGRVLRDAAKDSLDSCVTAINATIDVVDGILDASGNLDATDVVGDFTVAASNDVVAVTDSSSATNTLVSNGVIDGEYIKDDTIDDDSIDFGDVTGADLTLTDCTTVTASATVTGKEIAITEGTFDVVNTTQLVFIASGVTNVIDADITN